MRHGLVRWAHTSFKTGSTRYRLTQTTNSPLVLSPFLVLVNCRSRVRHVTVRLQVTRSRFFARFAIKFTWSTDAEHRRSRFEVVIVSKSFRPGVRVRPVASFSNKIRARSEFDISNSRIERRCDRDTVRGDRAATTTGLECGKVLVEK